MPARLTIDRLNLTTTPSLLQGPSVTADVQSNFGVNIDVASTRFGGPANGPSGSFPGATQWVVGPIGRRRQGRVPAWRDALSLA